MVAITRIIQTCMSQKSIILVVIIFALLVVGMFMYAYMKKAELTSNEPPQTEEIDEETVLYPYITRIDAVHYYIDGVHTIVGEIEMPTPCDLLEVESVVMESFPEQVVLNFSVINTAEACIQVITSQRFMAEFSASPEAVITASFMGRSVDLNLIPAPQGETPDQFELFIKG